MACCSVFYVRLGSDGNGDNPTNFMLSFTRSWVLSDKSLWHLDSASNVCCRWDAFYDIALFVMALVQQSWIVWMACWPLLARLRAFASLCSIFHRFPTYHVREFIMNRFQLLLTSHTASSGTGLSWTWKPLVYSCYETSISGLSIVALLCSSCHPYGQIVLSYCVHSVLDRSCGQSSVLQSCSGSDVWSKSPEVRNISLNNRSEFNASGPEYNSGFLCVAHRLAWRYVSGDATFISHRHERSPGESTYSCWCEEHQVQAFIWHVESPLEPLVQVYKGMTFE